MTEILRAKPIVENLKNEITERVRKVREKGISPTLAIIRIGDDPASEFYFNAKLKRAAEFGIETRAVTLSETSSKDEVYKYVDDLSDDQTINGVMVEAPVPGHLDYKEIVNRIPWQKDVDGATYQNLGRLMSGQKALVAATPLAVMKYLEHMKLEQGCRIAVINRTITVGRPLSQLLLNSNYTPTVCHSKTRNLAEVCRNSDVVVVAAGKPGFLTRDMVTPNSVVVDVGINSVNGKITGDVDRESVENYVKILTPVPGGVGSLTSSLIFENLLRAIDYQHS